MKQVKPTESEGEMSLQKERASPAENKVDNNAVLVSNLTMKISVNEEVKTNPKQKIILVAEDDEFNFLLIESLLQNNNFNVLHAKNGKEAVMMHQSNSDISLIMMDLQMPEMDGFAATTEIRKTDKNIPVIAHTAYVVAGVKEKALGSGCNDFITKPLDPELILIKIKSLLDNSKTTVN